MRRGTSHTKAEAAEVDDKVGTGFEECPHRFETVLLVSQYNGRLYCHIDMHYPHTAMEPH